MARLVVGGAPPWIASASLVGALLVVAVPVASSLTAAGAEPARLRIAAALIDEVVRSVLPIDLVVPAALGAAADGGVPPSPNAVVLTELRYCGATDRGTGRFRGVMRSASQVGGSAPVLTGDEACRLNLPDLTNHLADKLGRDDPGGIGELEATWRGWELRLALIRLIGPPTKPGDPRPLAGLESRRDLLSLPTSNLRLVTDAGDTLTVHIAPAFAADGIDLSVMLGEQGGGPPTGRIASGGPAMTLGGGVNVTADLPHAFSNQLLRQFSGAQRLSIPVERDQVDLQNLGVSGAVGGLTVTALATPHSLRETMRLTVLADGEEVQVASVRADAQLETCTGLGTLAAVGCGARNGGRSAAAATLSAVLTDRYQGQAVRNLAGAQTLRFEVAARRLEFQGEIVHAVSGMRALSLAGHFRFGGVSH